MSAIILPAEADAPLAIDANAPLPTAVPVERLKTFTRRFPQVIKALCGIELAQSLASAWLDFRWESRDMSAQEDHLGRAVAVAADHYEYDNATR